MGNYDIKKVTSAILDKVKEKEKRKTKSLVDKYAFFLRKWTLFCLFILLLFILKYVWTSIEYLSN